MSGRCAGNPCFPEDGNHAHASGWEVLQLVLSDLRPWAQEVRVETWNRGTRQRHSKGEGVLRGTPQAIVLVGTRLLEEEQGGLAQKPDAFPTGVIQDGCTQDLWAVALVLEEEHGSCRRTG